MILRAVQAGHNFGGHGVRSGMWGVERNLFSEFLGGREGMKDRRKVVKHATATATVSPPLLVSEQTLIVL